MRAKFVSTTNKGLDRWIPKEVWGNLEINKIAIWSDFNSTKCFHTSIICSYVYKHESKLLNLETANSQYVFRLEEAPKEEEMLCGSEEDKAFVRLIQHRNANEKFSQAILQIELYTQDCYEEEILLNPPMSYYEARECFVGNFIRDENNSIIGEVCFVIPTKPLA
ncbi:MAG: hypothetical protein EOM50_16655 [Erysipelotrichia bacterium]|nr:hypothetical protein [Erysipelotrichia bacterium]